MGNFREKQIYQIIKNKYLKNFENLSLEKKTPSIALGFEPRSFENCI